MRVILSNAEPAHDKQKIEFELIDPDHVKENPSITLIEKESLASITIPLSEDDFEDTSVSVAIDPERFHFEQAGQDEFEWQMFYCCGSKGNRIITQAESEFAGPRRKLGTSGYYQYDFDPSGMATFYVRTNRSEDQFVINTINLNAKSLKITGFSQIDGDNLTDMKIIVRHASDKSENTFDLGSDVYQGIFSATVPTKYFTNEDTYRLYIEYDYKGKHYHQRLVIDDPMTLFKNKVNLPAHQQLVVKKGKNGQIRLVESTKNYKLFDFKKLSHKFRHLSKNFKIIIAKIKRIFIRKLFKMGHTPYSKTTIVFESFGGRQVSDSPYAIYQVFKKMYPKLTFVWSVNKSMKKMCKENNIPYVVKNTFKWSRTMSKSKVWISNARFPAWVKKPNYITYVQTWHGTPLKKLGLDIEKVSMPGTTTNTYHQNFVREANRWDALISPNDYSSEIFRSAFGYYNKILKVGYPRNDDLINKNDPRDIDQLKAKLGIPKDKKVVLYAPTYRDNQFETVGKYTFKLPFSLEDFKKRFGEDTVLILRMHYLISNALDISDYSDFVYDLSSYPNISDLYLVSDLLITDYSSVFFDYAYLKRPILFYPYDYHMYKDDLRGFYLNYERDLPGEIVHDEDGLMDGIQNGLKHPNMSENQQFMDFYNKFCRINDGLSSIKVIDYVMQQIK